MDWALHQPVTFHAADHRCSGQSQQTRGMTPVAAGLSERVQKLNSFVLECLLLNLVQDFSRIGLL